MQVWVPALSDREDMEGVVQKAFMMGNGSLIDEGYVAQMASRMLDFAWWFNNMVRLASILECYKSYYVIGISSL